MHLICQDIQYILIKLWICYGFHLYGKTSLKFLTIFFFLSGATTIFFIFQESCLKYFMLLWMKLLADLIFHLKYLNEAQSNFEQYRIKILDAKYKTELEEYLRNHGVLANT